MNSDLCQKESKSLEPKSRVTKSSIDDLILIDYRKLATYRAVAIHNGQD